MKNVRVQKIQTINGFCNVRCFEEVMKIVIIYADFFCRHGGEPVARSSKLEER